MPEAKNFLFKLHGLRGIAIAMVLLFHFFGEIFPSGFLGVDLFFILSGFLVSKSVLEKYFAKIDQPISWKEFLLDFYSKRFARIFPMVLVSSLVSLFLALFFIEAQDINKYIKYFFGSLAGVNNIIFHKEAGNYFSKNLEFNFFTQTWSLGVEEQFYVMFSLAFLGTIFLGLKSNRLRNFKNTVLAFTIISFFLNIYSFKINHTREAKFFLLHFRLWEMGIGVLCLLCKDRLIESLTKITTSFYEITFLVIIIATAFLPSFPTASPFPIVLPLVFSAVSLIIFSFTNINSLSERLLLSKPLQYLGTISYSLYLVHWVVLVLLKHTFGLTFIHALAGLVLSILFSAISYKFIEKPALGYFRNKQKLSISILLAMVIIIGLFFTTLKNGIEVKSNPFFLGRYVDLNVHSWGEEMLCHGKADMQSYQSPMVSCLKPDRANNKRAVFLAGDSHAVQMFFMLQELFSNKEYSVRYINMESPDDVYAFTESQDFKERPEVFEYLLKESTAGDLVFLTFASYRLNDLSNDKIANAKRIWEFYVREFNKKGVKVVLALDSPTFDKEPIELCPISVKFFGNYDPCEISIQRAKEKRLKQDEFFKIAGATHIDLFNYLCENGTCSKLNNGKLKYFDYHHYTKETSQGIGKMLKADIAKILQ